MTRLFAILATLTWALWFGGIIALFVFVATLFRVNRAMAVETAPLLFGAFERMQLVLAAIAILSVVAWYWKVRSRLLAGAFALLVVAAAGAVLQTVVVTRQLETLRWSGQSDTPQFRKLHGQSMIVYTSQAALLLINGVLLSLLAAREQDRARSDELSPNRDAPPPIAAL